ncbi:acyl-CoA thioesterase [Olsenella sp. HMSC062G07]|uniref:acyl-CoA thioesterase n=1 Tax=Olsenella sp. HMSC062G07 TaxID=1739330 RepID=UPI0008B64B01|nr:hotdog domain-containing protein [Olsenella sp. HMSC062G07]OFK22296.1 hypothetical protein HMPREF2826_01990 [Olsenella sp. HMSC062G07]
MLLSRNVAGPHASREAPRPVQPLVTHRFVATGELNHHGTLFGTVMAQWFVEAAFLCAVDTVGDSDSVVFVRLHDMDFVTPVHLGETLRFEAVPLVAGTTSLTVHARARVGERPVTRGFVTFVHVDGQGRPLPHGLRLEPSSDEERSLVREVQSYLGA